MIENVRFFSDKIKINNFSSYGRSQHSGGSLTSHLVNLFFLNFTDYVVILIETHIFCFLSFAGSTNSSPS